MEDTPVTPVPEDEALVLKERLQEAFARELDEVVRLVAGKQSAEELFGAFEFALRDRMLRLGAAILQAGLDQVKKKLTAGPQAFVLDAARS